MLEEVVGHVDRVHEVPPGVDVDEFRPRAARRGARRRCSRRPAATRRTPATRNERLPDEGNAERLAAFFADDEPTVVYFGKLLYNKGVHLLLEALRELDARAVIVGFGDYRAELEARRAAADALHRRRSSTATSSTCSRSPTSTVVPSIFPEAFGMVAAEAAAAGSPPLVARHSGLEEIADGLEAEYPPEYRAPGELRHGRRRRPGREAARAARPCRASERARIAQAARQRRRAPLELGERRRTAAPSLSLM